MRAIASLRGSNIALLNNRRDSGSRIVGKAVRLALRLQNKLLSYLSIFQGTVKDKEKEFLSRNEILPPALKTPSSSD